MATDRFSARVVRPGELLTAEIGAWDQLVTTQPALSSPFMSFQYCHAVEKAGIDVNVCVLSQSGRICGFFPFQFSRRIGKLLKSATPVGDRMSDYFGLVAETSIRITPHRLLDLAGLNHISFSHLDETQLTYGLTGESPRTGLRIQCSPFDADHPVDDIFSKKPLKEMQRREKHLIDELGPIQFTFNVPTRRDEQLQQLIRQKRAQYARTGAADALAAAWKIRLLECLLKTNTVGCYGVLSELRAGDQWIASHFGILGNGVLQYWLPVYNPAMAKYGPGKMLLRYVYDAARAQGIHTIDRGEGLSDAKKEIRSDEHLFYRGTWHNGSLAALLVRICQSLAWRLKK